MQQEWYQSSLFSILIILGPFRWNKYSKKQLGKVRPELRPQFPAWSALRKCLTMPEIYLTWNLLNSTDIYWHVVRIDNWNNSISFSVGQGWSKFLGSWTPHRMIVTWGLQRTGFLEVLHHLDVLALARPELGEPYRACDACVTCVTCISQCACDVQRTA